MRRIIVHMQMTLNNRIATDEGLFWEPFPWGDEEMAYITEAFRRADTWAMGRRSYEAIVPWWDTVADGGVPQDASEVSNAFKEFAKLLRSLDKVVFSSTLEPSQDRVVLRGDLVRELRRLKELSGRDIILSAGPATIGPLASGPGLIDEYLLAVHPAVTTTGPQLFSDLTTSLSLRLLDAKAFDSGCIVLHYERASS